MLTRSEPTSNRIGCTLLGDIGATNARLALLANDVVGPVRRFDVAKYPHFQDVVTEFLDHGRGAVTEAVIAVAGPVDHGRSVLTNHSWTIDASELRGQFGLAKVHVLNDFEATASSLPNLKSADVHPIGGGRAVPDAPMAVLGPGTGLGVACLVPHSPRPIVIASEGGHSTLPATSAREDALIAYWAERFGHVSAERLVSGAGLENLYEAIAALDDQKVPARDAAEITKCALEGSCAVARAALETFCAFLGSFAGNVALMFGARGGVYIAGGIAPRIVDFIARSAFRERFEAKGRFRSYLEAIPANVVVHPAATFVGLKSIAERHREPAVSD